MGNWENTRENTTIAVQIIASRYFILHLFPFTTVDSYSVALNLKPRNGLFLFDFHVIGVIFVQTFVILTLVLHTYKFLFVSIRAQQANNFNHWWLHGKFGETGSEGGGRPHLSIEMITEYDVDVSIFSLLNTGSSCISIRLHQYIDYVPTYLLMLVPSTYARVDLKKVFCEFWKHWGLKRCILV